MRRSRGGSGPGTLLPTFCASLLLPACLLASASCGEEVEREEEAAPERPSSGAASASPASADEEEPASTSRLAAQEQPQPPTHRNVRYGPHERNVMDVWVAESETRTPVLVYIHGGGFRAGNKVVNRELLLRSLDEGVSVVSITYRLSDQAIAPAQFMDAARAIQFIRYKADEWGLAPRRVAATGGSAGAGLSLWLGLHDDLADPDNSDPVLRHSTRLTATVAYDAQSSYDPRFIRDLFPGAEAYREPALAQLFGVDLERLDELSSAKYELFESVSPINHVSEDDPPALVLYSHPLESYGSRRKIHHPRFGFVLEEAMREVGVECQVMTGVMRYSERWLDLTMEFLERHFRP